MDFLGRPLTVWAFVLLNLVFLDYSPLGLIFSIPLFIFIYQFLMLKRNCLTWFYIAIVLTIIIYFMGALIGLIWGIFAILIKLILLLIVRDYVLKKKINDQYLFK